MYIYTASQDNIERFSHLETLPYTYLLIFTHPETNSKSFYYGCRFAKHCHPNDLMNGYQTSSGDVKHLMDLYGSRAFKAIVRFIFPNDIDSCREFESKILKGMNVRKKSVWLNNTDNKSFIRSKHTYTKEFGQKISRTRLERKIPSSTKGKIVIRHPKFDKIKYIDESDIHLFPEWMRGMSDQKKQIVSKRFKGVKNSQEHNKNIANGLRGLPKSAEHKAKLSLAARNEKRIQCQYCGNEHRPMNLKRHERSCLRLSSKNQTTP